MASEAAAAGIPIGRDGADERAVPVTPTGETTGETARRGRHAGPALTVLRTVAGPDAGRALTLAAGTYVVGRAAGVDIALDDPALAGRQAILAVDVRGAVTVTDLSAPRPTRVDGVVAGGPAPVRPGQRLTIGATMIVVEPPPGSGAAPRPDDVAEPRPVAVPAGAPIPGRSATLVRRWVDRARADAARARFAADLALHQAAVADARQRGALELPAAVRAATTGDQLWARGGGAFTAVVGRGDRWEPPVVDTGRGPLPDEWWALVDAAALLRDVPVTVDVGPGAVVGVVGPPAFARPVARSLVLQLAVAHGPLELAVAAVVGPASPEWDWLQSLPHAREDAGLWHRLLVIDGHPPPAVAPGAAALVVAGSEAALPIRCHIVVEARADGSAVVRCPDRGELGDHVAAAGASRTTARVVATALTRRARSDEGANRPGH